VEYSCKKIPSFSDGSLSFLQKFERNFRQKMTEVVQLCSTPKKAAEEE